MKKHRTLNDKSPTGMKILDLLRECQGRDLPQEAEVGGVLHDVSVLEESGRLLWEQIFHTPDFEYLRAAGNKRSRNFEVEVEIEIEIEGQRQSLSYSPIKDYSSEDSPSDSESMDSDNQFNRSMSSVSISKRQRSNTSSHHHTNLAASLPMRDRDDAIHYSKLAPKRPRPRVLSAHTALCCPYPTCRRYRLPLLTQGTLDTHIRKYHATLPHRETIAIVEEAQVLQVGIITEMEINAFKESPGATGSSQPGHPMNDEARYQTAQSDHTPVQDERQLVVRGGRRDLGGDLGIRQVGNGHFQYDVGAAF